MNLHFHPIVLRKTDMMITDLFMRRDRADKGDDSFVSPFHPDINIARSPGIRIRIHQCISLPFQDTGSESLLSEPLRNLDDSIIQSHIRLLQHLALQHPLQKQVLAHSHLSRWQLLDAIKENAHQTLLLGDTV